MEEYTARNPGKKLIRMGIGDVTLPLVPAVVAAMQAAVAQMSCKATFRGYGPEQGYLFLREAVAEYYAGRGACVDTDDIFITDGAKSALRGVLDVFSSDNTVLIPSPVYPVYADANIIDGRKIVYLPANEENGFLPMPNEGIDVDIIYLCSPNNPTGAVYTRQQLARWVSYAMEKNAVILFDAAYEAFIPDLPDNALPHSIYEIDGAQSCAIELCSFSKTAGFTGTRCGCIVVPSGLTVDGTAVKKLWARRQAAAYGGTAYVVQRGAQAVFSKAGMAQMRANLNTYHQNADIITETLRGLGVWFTGGECSPYIWLKCPPGFSSWQFFDKLLEECGVVGTPGSGFGEGGEGYLRLSAFGDKGAVEIAIVRIAKMYKAL